MKVSIKGYIYHKENENFSGCHDRYAFQKKGDNFSFAIADGVSRSFFPDIWANILVEEYTKLNDKDSFFNNLPSYREKWLEKVKCEVEKPNQKWFVKNMFLKQEPAASTFVGLDIFRKNSTKDFFWNAEALGDSFLFFIPEEVQQIEENLKNIEYLSSKDNFEFDNFPDYFISRETNDKGKLKKVEETPLKAGKFYLMTDALAEWFINYKDEAVKEIDKWKNQDDFKEAVDRLRSENKLNNDDSAILIIGITNITNNQIETIDSKITNIYDLITEEIAKKEKEEREKKEEEEKKEKEKNKSEKDSNSKNSKQDTNNLTTDDKGNSEEQKESKRHPKNEEIKKTGEDNNLQKNHQKKKHGGIPPVGYPSLEEKKAKRTRELPHY